MRLGPIERPKSITIRFAYWMVKRRLGKVIAPLKVMYSRVPKALPIARAFAEFGSTAELLGVTSRELVLAHIAALNACAFCVDISRMRNMNNAQLREKLGQLPDYENNSAFTESERAALAFADELTRTRRISDACFYRVKQVLRDDQIAELTILCAMENFYNMCNHALEIPSDDLCSLSTSLANKGHFGSVA